MDNLNKEQSIAIISSNELFDTITRSKNVIHQINREITTINANNGNKQTLQIALSLLTSSLEERCKELETVERAQYIDADSCLVIPATFTGAPPFPYAYTGKEIFDNITKLKKQTEDICTEYRKLTDSGYDRQVLPITISIMAELSKTKNEELERLMSINYKEISPVKIKLGFPKGEILNG